jgi:pimeloyl-ACP methyl ester carboxylesterase
MKRIHQITGHGGVNLHITDLGPLDAPVIILIHGYSQCGLSFLRQHALSDTHRLIIPDLRGHGQSDKPLNADAYNISEPWANDVKTIIDTLELQNPLLLGWSMGGWVVNDYIRIFGDVAIAGIVLVGSSVTTGQHLPPAALAARTNNPDVAAAAMRGDDLDANLTATAKFVQVCFSTPLPAETLAFMTGFNMLCPPEVREACRTRNEDYRDTSATMTKPALILWGKHEPLAPAPMGEQALATFPNATARIYENSGHSPFWEEADRFNTDLAAFADQAFRQAQGAAA